MKNWRSLPQAARAHGVSEKTVIALVEAGRISSRNLPGATPQVYVPELRVVLAESTRHGSVGLLAAQECRS